MIRFKTTGNGRREPVLVGTHLYVYQVISTLREHDGDIDETAEYLSLRPQQVSAALAYYADFKDEVDADAEAARLFEEMERARWERQQQDLK